MVCGEQFATIFLILPMQHRHATRLDTAVVHIPASSTQAGRKVKYRFGWTIWNVLLVQPTFLTVHSPAGAMKTVAAANIFYSHAHN